MFVRARKEFSFPTVRYEQKKGEKLDYRVTKMKWAKTIPRSFATNAQYILRLIGQVITVSLETVKIVESLPPLGLPE